MKKFIVVLAFCVVFMAVITRAEDEEDEEDEYEDEEESWDPRLFASAMQLNNNNVGDINNVKVNFEGELHNKMSSDIITIIAQLMNGDLDLNGDDDDDDEDDDNGDDDDDEDIEECPEEGIKFISHPENCEKYILCIEGEEVATLECPDELHFSRELRACTDPEEAECE